MNVAGEDESYDFGTGAGFYVDATEAPWSSGYRMYSYVTKDLPNALSASFPQLDPASVSISGHSMGGHGALTLVSHASSTLQLHWGRDGMERPQRSTDT